MTSETTIAQLSKLAPPGVPSPQRWAQDMDERLHRQDLYLVDMNDPEVLRKVGAAIRERHTCSESHWSPSELAVWALDAVR